MLIKSAALGTASGSLGGMTAARNRGGQYLRQRVVPVDRSTDLQRARRASLASVSGLWSSGLTADQREAWGLFADATPVKNRLGDLIKLSGHQAFCASAALRASVGLAPILEAPTDFTQPQAGDLTLAANDLGAGTITIGVAGAPDWAADPTAYLAGFVGRPQGPGIGFFKGPWRYGSKTPGVTITPVTTAVITSPFPLAEGQKVWVAATILLADGRSASPVTLGPRILHDD